MPIYVLPVLFTLLVWWLSTGVILYLDGLPRRTYRWSFLGATAILAAALYGLTRASEEASVTGAYVAFTSGVLVWGWIEMSFLMGFATGPRRTACPEGCHGWRHAGHAIQTILYHELVLIASAIVVIVLSWGDVNQVGAWTFLALWAMRQSAKLNLFLGVRNLSEEFLPEHLRYLGSFFARKPMNLLFPVSVTIATAVAVLVWRDALAPNAEAFHATGLAFVGTLLALAVLEHWFLVLPLPASALWRWGLRSRSTTLSASPDDSGSPARCQIIGDAQRALRPVAVIVPAGCGTVEAEALPDVHRRAVHASRAHS
jgi:putative photosynthetic complex assembly protein 2